jgi:hypothetical protein
MVGGRFSELLPHALRGLDGHDAPAVTGERYRQPAAPPAPTSSKVSPGLSRPATAATAGSGFWPAALGTNRLASRRQKSGSAAPSRSRSDCSRSATTIARHRREAGDSAYRSTPRIPVPRSVSMALRVGAGSDHVSYEMASASLSARLTPQVAADYSPRVLATGGSVASQRAGANLCAA